MGRFWMWAELNQGGSVTNRAIPFSLYYKTRQQIFNSRESSLFHFGLKKFTNVLKSYLFLKQ